MQLVAVWLSAKGLLTLAEHLVDVALKATLLLGLAAGLALLWRRKSAALRHLVWSTTLAVLVALPALSWLLPAWRALPSWLALSPASAGSPAAGELLALDHSQTGHNAQVRPSAVLATEVDPARTSPAVVPVEQPALVDSLDRTSAPGERAAASAAMTGATASTAPVARLFVLLAVVWGLGAAALLARLLFSRWRLGRLCQRGAPATTGLLHDEHRHACRELGIRRPVALVLSETNTIPLAFGVLRSRVVLPRAAQAWELPQRRTVLLHELGHVARHDPLWQLLAQIAEALYWPNPCVWLAAWRVEVERERACDDVVLNRGVAPADYARHLLDVVSGGRLRRLHAAAGIAMAASRKLEDRLRSILGPARSRSPVTRGALIASLLMAATLAAPLAMMRAQDSLDSPMPEAGAGRADQPEQEEPAVETNAAGDSPADSFEDTDAPVGPVNPGLTPDHHTVAMRYDESMLVVWNQAGALGIVFEQPADAPAEVRYQWRMVDLHGKESSGGDTLSTTATDPQPLGVGELQIVATFLNSSLGHFDYNPDEVAVTPLGRNWFARLTAPAPGLGETRPVALSKFLYPEALAAQMYREREHGGPNSMPFSAGSDVTSFVRYGSNGLVVSTIDGTAAFVFGAVIDRARGNEHYYGVNYRWRFVSWDGTVSFRGTGAVQEVYVDEQYSSNRTTHYLEAGPVHVVWSQGGAEGGWVYHNPAWHAVWFVDRGRGQELLQPRTPNSQLLRFAYGRHQPQDSRQAAAEEAAAEAEPTGETPTGGPPAEDDGAAPTKPLRTEKFAHVIHEQDGWMRLVPETDADRQWIDAILSWGSNDHDGWRVGALLVNDLDSEGPLKPGDPAAVRYFLQNVSAEARTIRVQSVDDTYPVLGEGGQLNLNLMHRGENIEFTALPGEAVSPGGFEIPIDTAEMQDGQYNLYTISAFSRPDEDGSGGGSPWRAGGVTLTIGEGGQFAAETQADEQGIVWGGSVAGLRVGMRMSNRRPRQALGVLLQGDMFVWNTTDQAITLEWDPPAPLDQNQVVYDEQGQYVNLNRVFYTGFRPRNPQTFTLQPGEQTQVGSSVLQSVAEATQPGPSDPAQVVATTGKFTWQVYLSLSLQELPQYTIIAGSGPVPIEIVAE